jgi:uncharacterized lipoprotein YajG
MGRLLLLVTFIMLGTGCTLISEKVTLKPNVLWDQENIGNGAKVSLIIEDKRSAKEIGYRNPLMHSGLITLNDDIKKVFKDQMKQILEAKGFVVVDDNNSDRKCELIIRDFKYSLIMGAIDDAIDRRIVVDVDAVNNSANTDYFKNYFTNDEEHVFLPPTQERNEELINRTVGKLFNKISLDSQLYQSLSK